MQYNLTNKCGVAHIGLPQLKFHFYINVRDTSYVILYWC